MRLYIVLFKTLFMPLVVSMIFATYSSASDEQKLFQDKKKLAYIVSDSGIPFWDIMGRGVKSSAEALGYDLNIISSNNSAKEELSAVAIAIKNKVSGIIISPTTSSACVTVLKLAKASGIPVVISDIGTDSGEYVSYISSNNKDGAYDIGKVLAKKMRDKGFDNGRVAIIAIPQKRLNGQARTAGFMKAMDEEGIKGAGIKQQVTFSDAETYGYAKEMIQKYPDLHAIWLQGSNRYNSALRAIKEAGKTDDILLVTFDAEPEFLELIPKGILIGAAMQQPYLMGQKAVEAMDSHLNGKRVQKDIQLPILAVSTDNIADKLPLIRLNVLGIQKED